jgi:Bax protein
MTTPRFFQISLTALFIVTLVMTASGCQERILPAPPTTYCPEGYRDLQGYFSLFNYHLATLDKGVPPVRVSQLPSDLSLLSDIRQRKQLFYKALLPIVLLENDAILQERAELKKLLKKAEESDSLHQVEMQWLEDIGRKYRVSGSAENLDFRQHLLRKIDTLPVSLALAQAATESGWGTSRFAREGNNLFGEHTLANGEGMVPAGRASGAKFEVRIFNDLSESIRAYMLNLNSHRAYVNLRQNRERLRLRGKNISGLDLAGGLLAYSERGEDYVRDIRRIIEANNLTRFDSANLRRFTH